MDHESGTETEGQGGPGGDTTGEPDAVLEEAASELPRAAVELPNPFWSDRATEEFILRQARPLGLAEYDDQQLEPDYAASEAARSGGFRSLEAVSVRAQSPVPRAGERPSAEVPPGRASSSVPSVSSRSRSPAREDYASMRELLVSVGGAIASLAEEHRHTQQRLARVEETRSGSNSSMRTGREDNDSGNGRIVDLGVGPQFYQIGEDDSEQRGVVRSRGPPLEDWVQEPVRLRDVPVESVVLPQGVPRSYGPELFSGTDLLGLEYRRDTLALEAGAGSSGLAQVGIQGAGTDLPVPVEGAILSAQASGLEGAIRSAQASGLEGAIRSAQASGLEGAIRSAQASGLEGAIRSAQASGLEGAIRSAQASGLEGAIRSAQASGLEGAILSAQASGLEGAILSAQASGLEGAIRSAQASGLEGAIRSAQASVSRVQSFGPGVGSRGCNPFGPGVRPRGCYPFGPGARSRGGISLKADERS